MNKQINVREDSNSRLDVFLNQEYSDYSRSYFQRLIKSGMVKVNNCKANAHYIVKKCDIIDIIFEEKISVIKREDIPLSILYEDEVLLVLNKAPGIVVHPACGHPSGTLVNAVMGYSRGAYVPMLVHRLDKDTSGVIIVAKTEKAKNSLVKQFQKRAIKKKYLAAVKGRIVEKKGRIDAPLGRDPNDRKKIVVGPNSTKSAVTEFVVRESNDEFSLIEVYPLTGRTHQIRSHFAYIGHPVLGDVTYGGAQKIGKMSFYRQMLHASWISLTHPTTRKKIEFSAPIPTDMLKIWNSQ